MKRAIVSVTNDLCTDQRVAKTCSTLLALNYDVILIGRKLKNSLPISREYKTKRFKLLFNTSFLFYAEYNIRLFFFLLFNKKTLLISNDLDTLLANYLVSRLQKKELVYDSHELFTEIPELVTKPFIKRCWSFIEKVMLPKLNHVIVVSESIAGFYKKKYGISPHVIRNLPQTSEIELGEFTFDPKDKKVILYQGAINIGRGLELMIDTMPLLDDFIFVMVGDGDILKELKKKVISKRLESNVFFMKKIAPEKLKTITPLADIGISIEEDLGLNYRYALPNKLFDYIHAEIPVITSNLPEMSRITTHYKIGEVVNQRTPKSMANVVLSIDKKNYLEALKKAKKELQWHIEREKLIHIFKHLN
ncbi:MAG: glycosyltransferase [Flavobacteriaceae bacterium]